MFKVEKRNGEFVDFNKQKIIDAINAAFIEVDGTLYEEDTAKDIAEDLYRDYSLIKELCAVPVETIQNDVENYLMRSERKDVARAYIRYRYKKRSC